MRVRGTLLLFLIAVVGGLADKGVVGHSVGEGVRITMMVLSYIYAGIMGVGAVYYFFSNPIPFSFGRNFMFVTMDCGLIFLSAVICHFIGWSPSDGLLLACVAFYVYLSGKLPSDSDCN